MGRLHVRTLAIALLGSILCCGLAGAEDGAKRSKKVEVGRTAAIGIWRIPASARAIRRKDTTALPGITLFAYDGAHVTLSLVTEKAWMWRSPDDFYKLEARWASARLQIRLPFGGWEPLATFEGDRFVYHDTTLGLAWDFEPVKESQLEGQERLVLSPREPHDYRIRPTDPR